MQADDGITSFGNFLRWQLDKHRGPSAFARKTGIALGTIERYCRADDGLDLNIRPYNADALAKALGFTDWFALDAAWKTTSLPPYPMRSAVPKWAQDAARRGQLPTMNMTPHALIEAVKQLDHDAQVELVKALDADVLAEVVPPAKASSADSAPKPKGMLLHYQLEALAEAGDAKTLAAVMREIERQVKERGKK